MGRIDGWLRGLAIGVLLWQVPQSHAWTLEEAAKPYKGVTLRTIGESLPPLEAMKAMAPEFTKRTGIKVEIEMYEHSEAVNKVMLDLNSKRARYDFILQPHRELGKFVANKHLQAIDRFLDDPKLRDPSFDPAKVLYPGLWKEISWYQGKVYGFPFTALTMYAWYRADLLNDPKERAGFKAKYGYELQPARDWKQYRDLAEWFTRPDQGFYGTALQGKRHEALWYEWINFLYSFGGDVLDVKAGSECGPVIVNSPEAIESLEYYKSLVKFSPPDTLNYFWDDVMALMQQGKVFELIMWNDATYAVAEDKEASTVAGKMAFDLVPQGNGGKVGQVEGWSYLVPASAKNQAAAYLFIQWMMAGQRTPRCLCRQGSPEARLCQGVDADQRSGQAEGHAAAVGRDDRHPRARDLHVPGGSEDRQGRARHVGEGHLQAPGQVRAAQVSGQVTDAWERHCGR